MNFKSFPFISNSRENLHWRVPNRNLTPATLEFEILKTLKSITIISFQVRSVLEFRHIDFHNLLCDFFLRESNHFKKN